MGEVKYSHRLYIAEYDFSSYKGLSLKRISHTIISLALLLNFILIPSLGLCHGSRTTDLEYKLKAAFLYNFIKFTKWPHDLQNESNAEPLIVCVAGSDPFGHTLEPLAQKKVTGRSIMLEYTPVVGDLKRLGACNVVFVAAQQESAIFLRELEKKPVLTISDEVGFCNQGGCIELREQDGKIRFIVNRSALKRQGLELSYQVYDLALEVIGD